MQSQFAKTFFHEIIVNKAIDPVGIQFTTITGVDKYQIVHQFDTAKLILYSIIENTPDITVEQKQLLQKKSPFVIISYISKYGRNDDKPIIGKIKQFFDYVMQSQFAKTYFPEHIVNKPVGTEDIEFIITTGNDENQISLQFDKAKNFAHHSPNYTWYYSRTKAVTTEKIAFGNYILYKQIWKK